jgi:hypothetical protein
MVGILSAMEFVGADAAEGETAESAGSLTGKTLQQHFAGQGGGGQQQQQGAGIEDVPGLAAEAAAPRQAAAEAQG